MRLQSNLGKNSNVSLRWYCRAGAAMLLMLALAGSSLSANSDTDTSKKVYLQAGWALQSSCQLTATGEQISTAGFNTAGWHSTEVPSTVVAALVADKTYPDPYYGKNLRDIPGAEYPIGKNFSLLPMPQGQPLPLLLVVSHRIQAPRKFRRIVKCGCTSAASTIAPTSGSTATKSPTPKT